VSRNANTLARRSTSSPPRRSGVGVRASLQGAKGEGLDFSSNGSRVGGRMGCVVCMRQGTLFWSGLKPQDPAEAESRSQTLKVGKLSLIRQTVTHATRNRGRRSCALPVSYSPLPTPDISECRCKYWHCTEVLQQLPSSSEM
jgi:hypothetical protein